MKRVLLEIKALSNGCLSAEVRDMDNMTETCALICGPKDGVLDLAEALARGLAALPGGQCEFQTTGPRQASYLAVEALRARLGHRKLFHGTKGDLEHRFVHTNP